MKKYEVSLNLSDGSHYVYDNLSDVYVKDNFLVIQFSEDGSVLWKNINSLESFSYGGYDEIDT